MKKHHALTVEPWPIDRPIPYARNPRQISERAVDAVAGSIREFGFRQPIIVDGQGVIIAGHTRLQAARKLGLTEVPVHVATDLDEHQARAFRLSDNRVAEFSEWDSGLLAVELGDLGDIDLGFANFDELLASSDVTNDDEESGGSGDIGGKLLVIVEAANEPQQEEIYNLLTERGYTCRLSSM